MSSVAPPASTVQALFNRIAPVYDQFNDRLSFGLHHIWKRMTVKWSGAQAGNTCLDLCCGSGDLAQLLAQQAGVKGQVFGVDFSANQLAIAEQRSQALRTQPWVSPFSPITWIEADVLELPFEPETFDAATMGYGLRNVTNLPQALGELYRVLKPEATAAILDFNHPESQLVSQFQRWYLQTVVVPAARDAGFAAEYEYLAPSLERFPVRTTQMELARQAGFRAAQHYPIAGGTMGVLVITK